MESEILALETEAAKSETLVRETETETSQVERSIAQARERLETLLRCAEISAAEDRKKLEDFLTQAESKLKLLRERFVVASGNLQLARQRQTDIRVRGESTTSKHALLEISLRSALGECYGQWDERMSAVKTAAAHCQTSEGELRKMATALLQDERNARAAVVKACEHLRAVLAQIEQTLVWPSLRSHFRCCSSGWGCTVCSAPGSCDC
jgi:hypothetical protein